MSRVVKIKGKVIIKNIELAQEAIAICKCDIEIKNNQFTFNQYDYNDGIYKNDEIAKVENIYLEKYALYLEQLAKEEQLKIQEEKRILREKKADIVIANAKKQGYKLKKEIRKDKISLVFQKRTY